MSNETPAESRKARAARRAGEFPPPPEPLPTPVIDSHTHLDITLNEGGTDGPDSVEAAIALARQVGVDRLVQVGVDVDSSRWGVEVARKHPAVVATVALHPNDAPRLPDLDAALREIEALAAEPRVRGIGETGLDTFRTGEEGRAAQEASFRAHIGFAKRYGKPLVIHDREAHTDVLRVLDDEGAPDTVVLHCFSGDAEFARECVRRGYVLSFAGTVTFGSAGALREAAVVTPPDQLLVETDAPYLTPTPYRGRPNASYLIPLTVRALAEVKNVDLAELCAAISATGDRVFGPW
ncbi:TatD family hydrolase [Planosporangium flavigriseum]|uniref:AraC family transcriptional regulator n=1 Tax=Planosporangium flavigriseum TaxID=373681 RepID=A0A8J3LJ33_9ACTN|nr:TatD family hydrolase [Planosporangium flavigriseum]NJC63542.1 TatD family hydrolase [Planosporangium flavigriseum]GIG72239.1 AraC family transcriptional regulator [Planosporangium flavigriseum]